MFKYYFNMAILYMCLYGIADVTVGNEEQSSDTGVAERVLSGNNTQRLQDYVYLFKSKPGRIDSNPKAYSSYFWGVSKFKDKSSYGAGGQIATQSNKAIDECLMEYCKDFISIYKPSYSIFKKLIIAALHKDGYSRDFIIDINKKIDDYIIAISNKKVDVDSSWFLCLYQEAINKPRDYFMSDLSDITTRDVTALNRFNEIEKTCESIYAQIFDKKIEHISCKDLAINWFTQKCGTGRYRSYSSSQGKRQIEEIKNKLDTKDGKPRYLIDIVFDGSGNTNSINLCGKGGSGKTFQILRVIHAILNEKKDILPFYIPLSSLEFSDDKSNCIIDYMVKEIGFGSTEAVKTALSQNASNVILFADGLNEISNPTIRRKIAIDICQIRQSYKTRFLVSSRQDHTDLFNTLNYGEDKYFIKAEVLDLSADQINDYFVKINCSVSYEDVPIPTRKLLCTPQGCVMYSELIGSDLESTIRIDSLGRLLECYCNSLLGVDSHNHFNNHEESLMRIGYHMVLHGWFTVSEEDILEIISTEEAKNLFAADSPTWSIFNRNNSNLFEFTHQNYRDLYCAKKFASLIKMISPKTLSDDLESIFVANNVTMNDEILELTSAFVGNGRTSIQSIIDIIRDNAEELTGKYQSNYDFPLSVLIRIYAFAHNNNISSLDLSDLDLTEVCLNGYELFERGSNKGIDLYGAEINFNTVLKVGFPTGSSAICTFENNDKTFIIAFDRTTAMIIDVEENQRQLVRNLPDFGWVNVAYPTTFNGEKCILLGCDSGKIAVFYPNLLEDNPKRILVDTNIKSKDGIQSILEIKQNGKIYYVFSNTDGWVFLYDCNNNELLDPISICTDEERENVLNEWEKYNSKMIVACRMDYDKSNNQVLISFGQKLYRMDLTTDCFDITEYKIDWNYQIPRLIKDIKVTDSYIFINEIDAISVIFKNAKSWEFVIDLEKRLSWREKFLRNELKIDEEIIQDVIAFERNNATPYGGKVKNFYFQKFSPIPEGFYRKEEGILVGVKTPNEVLYKQLPQFIEIRIRPSCKSIVKHCNITPIHTNQALATHTGVYYKLKSMPKTVFLATTSDDRSIDLIAPHDEEFVPQHIEGAYNGVRDIEIIDERHFVCAQYDGSLILFSYNNYPVKHGINREWLWKVTNVVKPHHGWTWKVKLFEKWAEKNQVVSCSYDGTVRITDFSESESSIPIIKSNQPIRGVYKRGADIWAFSPNAIYHAKCGEGKWISDGVYDGNKLGISNMNISLLANLGNDVPFVFYNTGKGTQGYIAALENRGELITKITCEDGVFLRKIKPYQCNGNDYLFAVGTKDEMAYVAVYQKVYNDYIADPISTCCPSSSAPNDFTIVNTELGIFVIIVNNNNLISYCSVNDDMKLTVYKDGFNFVDGQPLCISSKGNLILVGLLNGKILRIDSSSEGFTYTDFAFTHANLYSTPNVDISECDIQDEEAFVAQLKDYFSI